MLGFPSVGSVPRFGGNAHLAKNGVILPSRFPCGASGDSPYPVDVRGDAERPDSGLLDFVGPPACLRPVASQTNLVAPPLSPGRDSANRTLVGNPRVPVGTVPRPSSPSIPPRTHARRFFKTLFGPKGSSNVWKGLEEVSVLCKV